MSILLSNIITLGFIGIGLVTYNMYKKYMELQEFLKLKDKIEEGVKTMEEIKNFKIKLSNLLEYGSQFLLGYFGTQSVFSLQQIKEMLEKIISNNNNNKIDPLPIVPNTWDNFFNDKGFKKNKGDFFDNCVKYKCPLDCPAFGKNKCPDVDLKCPDEDLKCPYCPGCTDDEKYSKPCKPCKPYKAYAYIDENPKNNKEDDLDDSDINIKV